MNRTPRSRIKGILRQIFLISVERSEAMKRTGYKCNKCGIKATTKKGCEVKLEVHHVNGINVWDKIIDLIDEEILCVYNPDKLEPLCRECHDKETYGE